MADFAPAVKVVLIHEGGYSNHEFDPGGETRWGISKRAFPDLDIANLTVEEAEGIYRRNYWEPQSLDHLVHQRVATKVLDFSVLMGLKPAAQCLQRALRATAADVVDDGAIGPKTIAAANKADPNALLAALRSEGAGRLRCIAKRDSLKVFLKGWLRRAYS